MKRLLLTLLFAFVSQISSASHIDGGEIWYEYAGDANHPYRYNIYLIVYRDITGIAMCPGYCPASICIKSSCFPDQTVSAPLEPYTLMPGSDTVQGSYPGSIVTPGVTDCINTNAPSLINTEMYRFRAQVDLPGICSDYAFIYSVVSRNISDNITNGHLTIQATLNNTTGPTSSPVFQTPAGKSFCSGKTFNWSHYCIDPDGDSLFYSMETPLGGACFSSTPIAYTSGYSATAPLTSSTPISFDNQSGTLNFTPSQQENIVFKVDVTEYKNDPTYGLVRLGSISRDILISITSPADCKATPKTWLANGNTPSTSGLPKLHCGDSIITINFQDKIENSSIAPDGSDFAILNSKGTLVPIIGAKPSISTKSHTNSIDLKLYVPISYNDTLYLSIKKGSDANTLRSLCDFEVPAGDSLYLIVNDCQTSVSLSENSLSKLSLYPNPAKGLITLSSNRNLTGSSIIVYDVTNRPVHSHTASNKNVKLNISQLSKGIYYIRVSNNSWTQTMKFEKN